MLLFNNIANKRTFIAGVPNFQTNNQHNT